VGRVPLVAAAVCPHPPLLVPEVAAGAAGERDDLRAACDTVLDRVLAHEPEALHIIGSAPTSRQYSHPLRASFRPWGAAIEATLGEPDSARRSRSHTDSARRRPSEERARRSRSHTDSDAEALPLSLAVGVWLVQRAAVAGRIRRPTRWYAHAVAADASSDDCLALADDLRSENPWALLVMGDGSACRGQKSPGYDDPRAEPFDKTVAQALATADVDALLALDADLAAEWRVAGRAPWRVLAAAARDGAPSWHGDLLYEAAPYGVAYFVATWTPTPPPPPFRRSCI
jgi:hypothetical protein